jgi:hypothetical protein
MVEIKDVGRLDTAICLRQERPTQGTSNSNGRDAVFNHRGLAEDWLVRSEPRFLVWNRTSLKLQNSWKWIKQKEM